MLISIVKTLIIVIIPYIMMSNCYGQEKLISSIKIEEDRCNLTLEFYEDIYKLDSIGRIECSDTIDRTYFLLVSYNHTDHTVIPALYYVRCGKRKFATPELNLVANNLRISVRDAYCIVEDFYFTIPLTIPVD